jgi:NAD(P)H-hydrate epimerase
MKYQIFTKKDVNHKNIYSFRLTPEKKLSQTLCLDIPLSQNTYKKSFGKTLIIGGASGYLGAAIISGKAALYSGSRYVEIMTTKPHSIALPTYQPELITSYKMSDFQKKIISYKNLLIGPGMSNDDWSKKIFMKIKKYLSSQPVKVNCVIDGGFLSMLSKEPYKYDNWVMTPHIGEAAKLLNKKPSDIEADRLKAAKKLQEKYGGIIVLKGPKTIIQTKTNSYICNHGNQGMGTAGMGDCLAGTVLSLITLANKDDRISSVLFAVGIHSLAADVIKEETGDIGLLASQVIIKINKLLNEIKVK